MASHLAHNHHPFCGRRSQVNNRLLQAKYHCIQKLVGKSGSKKRWAVGDRILYSWPSIPIRVSVERIFGIFLTFQVIVSRSFSTCSDSTLANMS